LLAGAVLSLANTLVLQKVAVVAAADAVTDDNHFRGCAYGAALE